MTWENRRECRGSVTGHAQNDMSGRCCWCGVRVDPPMPMPDLRSWRTELDRAYRQYYDPDFGDHPYDL